MKFMINVIAARAIIIIITIIISQVDVESTSNAIYSVSRVE